MTRQKEAWLSREDNSRRLGENRGPSAREAQREAVLADWLGPERESAVMADLRPDKADVPALIQEILSTIGKDEMMVLTQVQQQWKEIVGMDNARMSQPLSLIQGVLRIKVLNSSFKFIFERQLKTAFLGKIREKAGEAVKSIEFVC